MTRSLKLTFGAATLACLAAAALPASQAFAQDPRGPRDSFIQEDGQSVDINTFYEALEPHGRWFTHSQYGTVWSPEVDRDWRPYTRGQWQFTEEHGWFWQAEEPWGWAVFHYGRWFLDDDSGWVWVPGTEWAPAWVAWRHSDEQVGWAPLPPEAEWRGNNLSFSSTYYDSPRFNPAWCFVPIALLTANRVYRHVYPPSRNVFFVRSTNWAPSHRYADRRIYNVGFDRYRYERLTRRPITPVRIVTVDRPHQPGWLGGQRGVVHAYRPRVTGTAATITPRNLVEPPRRDWQHGRPGITRPPFERQDRPGWGGPNAGPGAPNFGGQRPDPQPSILRPNQRPPLPQAQPVPQAPTPPTPPGGDGRRFGRGDQQRTPAVVTPPVVTPPAVTPPTPPGGDGRRFGRGDQQRTPAVVTPPVVTPPAVTPPANVARPSPPLIQPTPNFQRQPTQPQQPVASPPSRPAPQPQLPVQRAQPQPPAQQPVAQPGQRGGGGGGGQPGAGGAGGRGQGDGKGDGQARGKRPPQDPNAPPNTK